MKYFISLISLIIMLVSCKNEKTMNQEKLKSDILQVVKKHNKSWTVDENINAQMKFIHKDVQLISPPYDKISRGKQEYKEGYLEWMKHAKVDYFKEVNPKVSILNDGKTAFVTYHIEMSFEYDSVKVENWQGVDFMTLVLENGQWKIISDMYAKINN